MLRTLPAVSGEIRVLTHSHILSLQDQKNIVDLVLSCKRCNILSKTMVVRSKLYVKSMVVESEGV